MTSRANQVNQTKQIKQVKELRELCRTMVEQQEEILRMISDKLDALELDLGLEAESHQKDYRSTEANPHPIQSK